MIGPMANIRKVYEKMGLSQKEIHRRILCKCNKVLRGQAHKLDECDKKGVRR